MGDTPSNVPIVVATIGLLGTLGTAVIYNWDKLFPSQTAATAGDTTTATTASAVSPAMSPTTTSAAAVPQTTPAVGPPETATPVRPRPTTSPGTAAGTTSPGDSSSPGGIVRPPRPVVRGDPARTPCEDMVVTPLRGDEILRYKLVKRDSSHLWMSVEYRVNPARERVHIGGRLVGMQTGFRVSESLPRLDGSGYGKLELKLGLPGASTQLEVRLYDTAYRQPFACTRFPFRARFP